MDANEEVSRAARDMLLPVIGVWSLELGNFQFQLFTPFLKTAETVLKVSTRHSQYGIDGAILYIYRISS